MIDARVKAAVNLHAVLRTIEDLCELDPESGAIISDKKVAIRFSVPGIARMILSFANGKCQAISCSDFGTPEAPPASRQYDMNLYFPSPDYFNQMMDGKKNPIPTKGFRYISFLKNDFVKLAGRLTAYLRPDAQALADMQFRDNSTILTAYTAFFALSEIGNYDTTGKICASHIEDGAINILVKNSISIQVIACQGHLATKKGAHPSAKAFMEFDSIDTANGILSGRLDSYACIGNGKLSIRGRVPMIDNLNKLLALVAMYLA